MADDGEGRARRILREATGKKPEDFVDPSGHGFSVIEEQPSGGVVLSSKRTDGSTRPFPHLTIPIDTSADRATLKVDSVGPHYTEVFQDTSGNASVLRERKSFLDLGSGAVTKSEDKPPKANWVRRDSLGGDGGLPVFVQAENIGQDKHSKKNRVTTGEGSLDPRRTRRLSDATQNTQASQIGSGFNAFATRSAEAQSVSPSSTTFPELTTTASHTGPPRSPPSLSSSPSRAASTQQLSPVKDLSESKRGSSGGPNGKPGGF